MKYQSKVIENGSVSFPEFRGEKVYMVPFKQKDGLPAHLNRWQQTVDQMLRGVFTDETIYLMIDEQFVPAGKSHRRPGIHIDGYWNPGLSCHDGGINPSGHSPATPIHRPFPTRIVPKQNPLTKKKTPKKKTLKWENAPFEYPEALILASNVKASKGYVGEFSGTIGDKDDCSSIQMETLSELHLDANKVYIGNVTFLHESIPVQQDCFRTVVRLNVPGLFV